MALIKLKLNGFAAPVATGTPGTPVPLSAGELLVNGFSVQYNSLVNTTPVKLCDASGNVCMILSENSPSANFAADESEADEDRVVWNLAEVYIDSTVTGQQVYVTYFTQTSVQY